MGDVVDLAAYAAASATDEGYLTGFFPVAFFPAAVVFRIGPDVLGMVVSSDADPTDLADDNLTAFLDAEGVEEWAKTIPMPDGSGDLWLAHTPEDSL